MTVDERSAFQQFQVWLCSNCRLIYGRGNGRNIYQLARTVRETRMNERRVQVLQSMINCHEMLANLDRSESQTPEMMQLRQTISNTLATLEDLDRRMNELRQRISRLPVSSNTRSAR